MEVARDPGATRCLIGFGFLAITAQNSPWPLESRAIRWPLALSKLVLELARLQ
jgi:hypothetical protein